MSVSRDFTVGVFVIAAMLMLTVATFFLRHWDFISHRNTYYVLFNEVNRLNLGAPILAAGVPVGEVSRMEWIGGAKPVRVTMRINQSVQLYSNSLVRVVPAQVIGDTTLNIETTGKPGKDVRDLKPGDTLVGYEAPQLEDTITRVSGEMTEVLEGASAILNDPANRAALKDTMGNLASVTGKMDRTFELINKELMPVVADLKKSTGYLNDFLADARGLTGDATSQVNRAGDSFRKATGDYSQAAQTLTRAIQETATRLQQTIDRLDRAVRANEQPLTQTLDELRRTSRTMTEILQRIEAGQGTLGKLINDPRPFDQLRQVLSSISQTLTGQSESTFPIGGPSTGASRGGVLTPRKAIKP